MTLRRPRRPGLELAMLVALAWGVMAAGLAMLPALFSHVVDDPWPIVMAWGVVSLVWVPVEAVLRTRMGAIARFFLTVPLWVGAAVAGFWLRTALRLL